MSRFNDALNAMKTAVQTIDPAPQALHRVYVYPDDYPFGLDRLPVCIIHRMTNRSAPVTTRAVGVGSQYWWMAVDFLLREGQLQNDEQVQRVNLLYEPWVEAFDEMLSANWTLGGTVTTVGAFPPNGVFFIPVDAHLGWFKRMWWGIRCQVPILQSWDR